MQKSKEAINNLLNLVKINERKRKMREMKGLKLSLNLIRLTKKMKGS